MAAVYHAPASSVKFIQLWRRIESREGKIVVIFTLDIPENIKANSCANNKLLFVPSVGQRADISDRHVHGGKHSDMVNEVST